MSSNVQGGTIQWDLDIDDRRFHEKADKAEAKGAAVGAKLNALDFSKTFEKAASGFNSVADSLGNILIKTALVSAGGAAVGAAFIKSAADLQVSAQSFQVLIGNVGTANQLLGQLSKYANNTPFEFPDVAAAAKTLSGFGIETAKVLPTLKNLGNIAAVTGAPLKNLSVVFGQVVGAGRLQAENFLQLVDMGVPIGRMLQSVGINLKDLDKIWRDGGVSLDLFNKAFQQADAQGGFAFQGTTKLAETFNGRLSTLKDTVLEFGRNLFGVKVGPELGLVIEPGGVFDRLSKYVEKLTTELPKLQPAFQTGFNFIIDNGGTIVAIISAIGAAFVAAKTAGAVLNLATFLTSSPFALLAVAVTTLVGGLTFLEVKFHIISGALSALKPIIDPVVGALGEAGRVAGDVLGAALKTTADIFNGFVDGLKNGNPLITSLAIIVGTVAGAYAAVAVAQGVAAIAMGAWSVATGVATGITTALGVAVAIATSPFFLIALAVGAVIAVGYLLITNWKSISAFAGSLWRSITDAVGGALKAVGDFLGSLKDRAVRAIGDAGSWLVGIGGQIVDGLVRGLQGAWRRVIDVTSGLINLLPKVVRDILGIRSPSRVFAQLGDYMMQGLANGIADGGSKATDALNNVADGLMSAVGGVRGGIAVTGGLTGSGGVNAGTTVTQHNNFNVASGVDMQLIARELAWGASHA